MAAVPPRAPALAPAGSGRRRWAPLRRERRETVALAGAAGTRRRPPWLERSVNEAWRSPATTWSRPGSRARRSARPRGPREAAMLDARPRAAEPRGAARQSAACGAGAQRWHRRMPAEALPGPFRWEGDHIAAPSCPAPALFSTRRGGVSDGPFASLNLGLLPTTPPERRREPPAARRRGRAAVGALLLRAPGPRRDGPARHRAAGDARPTEEDGQATALARRRRDRVRRRLPAGDARRRRRRGRAALRLAPAGRRHRRRGRRGAARGRRRRPDQGRDRARRARLLLRGRRGGPRALRGLRRAARRAQPRPRGGRARAARGRGRRRSTTPGCARSATSAFFSHRRDHGVTGRQAGVVCRA